MKQLFRTFLYLPAILVALIVVPSIAFSKGERNADLRNVLHQTISPLPTPTQGSTVPPRPRPTRRPYPTATPHRVVAPTPTPTPTTPVGLVEIEGVELRKVIGDRLSSTLYAYTMQNWLYRSNNDGATWNLVTTMPAMDDFIMSAADPNLLYSGQGIPCDGRSYPSQPLYKSTDGGVNWSQVAGADNMRPLLVHQGDPNSIFAADCDQPYLSSDGGQSWVAKPDTSPEALWDTFTVIDMAAASLLGDPRPATPNWGQIFAGGVAADGSGVVVFSNDQGATWTRLTPNVYPASWGMNAVAVDVFIEGLLAFAEPKSVWQTSNYGVNWQTSMKGLENVANNGLAGGQFGLHDLVYHPNGQLYLATVRGLYVKAFNSQTWAKLVGVSFENSNINSLLYTESNSGTLWLNTSDGVYAIQL